MVTVYTWGSEDGLPITGHSSIAVGETYFSFHPLKKHLLRDAMGSAPDLADLDRDREQYGRPTSQVRLDDLDEERMYTRVVKIAEAMDKRTLNYNLFTTNCACLVADIMHVGAKAEFNVYKSMQQLWDEVRPTQRRSNSASVIDFVQDVTKTAGLFCVRRGKVAGLGGPLSAVLLAFDAASLTFVWTPRGVDILAKRWAEEYSRQQRMR